MNFTISCINKKDKEKIVIASNSHKYLRILLNYLGVHAKVNRAHES